MGSEGLDSSLLSPDGLSQMLLGATLHRRTPSPVGEASRAQSSTSRWGHGSVDHWQQACLPHLGVSGMAGKGREELMRNAKLGSANRQKLDGRQAQRAEVPRGRVRRSLEPGERRNEGGMRYGQRAEGMPHRRTKERCGWTKREWPLHASLGRSPGGAWSPEGRGRGRPWKAPRAGLWVYLPCVDGVLPRGAGSPLLGESCV